MACNKGMSVVILAALLMAIPRISLADHRGYGGHYGGHYGGYYGRGVPWWWIVPPLAAMATLPYRSYDPQPLIIQQPAPPMVIVQQPSGPQSAVPPVQSWYYCEAPKGYYPYVASCPGGWRPVSPTPPGVLP